MVPCQRLILSLTFFIAVFFHSSVAGPSWSYNSEVDGVSNWSHHFPICGGQRQSPIDIPIFGGNEADNDIYFKNYDKLPMAFVISNNGHSAVLTPTATFPEFKIKLGNLRKEYTFLNLHFHWGKDSSIGSEHTINGLHYPLEMHMVHVNHRSSDPFADGDGLAVLGVFFKLSRKDNKAFDLIIDSLSSIKHYKNQSLIEPFRLLKLLPKEKDIYRYLGSLTTPPCFEAVVWNVFKSPVAISERQMKHFRTLIDNHGEPMVDNFRPTAPLNGRPISLEQISGATAHILTPINLIIIIFMTLL
ncbi:CA4 (predicted) [Pycnogonum litorale]